MMPCAFLGWEHRKEQTGWSNGSFSSLTSIIFDLYTDLMPGLWWFISWFIYTPAWCPTPYCYQDESQPVKYFKVITCHMPHTGLVMRSKCFLASVQERLKWNTLEMRLLWFVHKAMRRPQGNIAAASMRWMPANLESKNLALTLTEALGWNM